MLLEAVDAQPGIDEGRDDLAEAVIPAVLLVLAAEVGGRIGIRPVDIEDERVTVLPVGVLQPQLPG